MVRIKICGLCNREDYTGAVEAGADYTGFIFFKESRRYAEPESVRRFLSDSRPGNHIKVGVFVNEKMELVREIHEFLKLDLVQLHGEETPGYCKALGLPYIKAFRVKDAGSISRISEYDCDTVLLDTFVSGTYGGTGQAFDHELIAAAMETGKKVIAAGGINPDNIVKILNFHPYGVDINSSVELCPGKKDLIKVRNMVSVIKNWEKTHAEE